MFVTVGKQMPSCLIETCSKAYTWVDLKSCFCSGRDQTLFIPASVSVLCEQMQFI